MTPAQCYRTIAAELRAMAACASSEVLAMQWDRLAKCYLRLAEQADKNDRLDLSAEFGKSPRLDDDDRRSR